jgi:RNA polymerase sigma-70 factor (ECF subfamily)
LCIYIVREKGIMTIESIIQGCQQGDSEARRELYQRYATAMFSLVRRYVRVRAAAEDVFHDGFVLVYTKIDTYDHRGSFEGWLRRIFVNAALNHLREEGRMDEVDEDVGSLPPGTTGGAPPEALGRIGDRELMELMEELPPGFRTILNLHAVEGYSYPEIAQMLDVSEATCRSQFLRARRRLAQLIEENEKR